MPEHFTRNTCEAKCWCNKCGKPTMHMVTDRRRSSCLDCIAKLESENTELKRLEESAPKQEVLF